MEFKKLAEVRVSQEHQAGKTLIQVEQNGSLDLIPRLGNPRIEWIIIKLNKLLEVMISLEHQAGKTVVLVE